jgi:hypothetical protein
VAEEQKGAAALSDQERFEPIIAPIREKYDGRIVVFRVGRHGVWILRYATGGEMRRFVKQTMAIARNTDMGPEAKDEGEEAAGNDLLKLCTAHPPELANKQAILDDYYTLIPRAVKRLREISGEDATELGKA